MLKNKQARSVLFECTEGRNLLGFFKSNKIMRNHYVHKYTLNLKHILAKNHRALGNLKLELLNIKAY